MPITKNSARKYGLIAEILLSKADLVTAVAEAIIDMPSGSIVDEIIPVVDETYDPTASAVIEFGTAEGTTNDLVASQNIFTGQAVGARAMITTAKGYKFTARGAIWAKYTSGGGLATQGKMRVIVHYHYENEADFVQN